MTGVPGGTSNESLKLSCYLSRTRGSAPLLPRGKAPSTVSEGDCAARIPQTVCSLYRITPDGSNWVIFAVRAHEIKKVNCQLGFIGGTDAHPVAKKSSSTVTKDKQESMDKWEMYDGACQTASRASNLTKPNKRRIGSLRIQYSTPERKEGPGLNSQPANEDGSLGIALFDLREYCPT